MNKLQSLIVHRIDIHGGFFLGIRHESWMEASRVLGANGLQLYLYFSSQRDGYSLGVSPKTIQGELGITAEEYKTQLENLIRCGYLAVDENGVSAEFYERPKIQTPKEEPQEFVF